jgi:hypothetical protein
MSTINIYNKFKDECQYRSKYHLKTSQYYSLIYNIINSPLLIISSASAILMSMDKSEYDMPVTILTYILTSGHALLTFYQFNQLSEKHRNVSEKYSDFEMELEKILSIDNDIELKNLLDQNIRRMSDIEKNSPTIPLCFISLNDRDNFYNEFV